MLKTEAQATTDTTRVLADMLRENTGARFLDIEGINRDERPIPAESAPRNGGDGKWSMIDGAKAPERAHCRSWLVSPRSDGQETRRGAQAAALAHNRAFGSREIVFERPLRLVEDVSYATVGFITLICGLRPTFAGCEPGVEGTKDSYETASSLRPGSTTPQSSCDQRTAKDGNSVEQQSYECRHVLTHQVACLPNGEPTPA